MVIKVKLVIHDIEGMELSNIIPVSNENIKVISDDGTIHNCIGCFGCWVKTPAACVIRDNYGDMGKLLSQCSKVIIISKCFYGGFSPFIKNVLDRSISYIHPYFVIRNGEMHHKRRYDDNFDLQVIFYGENITEKEKETAAKLVEANSVNLDCCFHKVSFIKNIEELEGIAI